MRKKSKEDEQTLEESNLVHCRSQAKCQFLQTSYIKRITLFLFLPYNKHHINRSKSVSMPWENVDLGWVCRPRCIRSVLTTLVKISHTDLLLGQQELSNAEPRQYFFLVHGAAFHEKKTSPTWLLLLSTSSFKENMSLPDNLTSSRVWQCSRVESVWKETKWIKHIIPALGEKEFF